MRKQHIDSGSGQKGIAQMTSPRLFIGSSVDGLLFANAVQHNLQYVCDATIWNQGAFELSAQTVPELLRLLDEFDFAAFIFSPDDALRMRGKEYFVTRDNVIFELGLFIGRIGIDR